MNESPVSIRAHFERFPATVKGAFVVRGEDRDPHQVIVKSAKVSSIAGHDERDLGMAHSVLEVAPKQNVFVPFELPVADLAPGWYGLECEVDIDGHPAVFPGGRRFVVPWPRATVRRGQVPVREKLKLGEGGSVAIDQVECGGDAIRFPLVVRPPAPVKIRLLADGSRLEILDVDFDEEQGRGRVSAYPLMRSHSALRIEVASAKTRGWVGAASVDVALP